MSEKTSFQHGRIYSRRVYEGEWFFHCSPECGVFLVEYSFYDYDHYADRFMDNTGAHTYERCSVCGSQLMWAGFSGDMPISDSLVALLRNKHFMAATVILAAIMENSLRNLAWAALVDAGVSKNKANSLVNASISRVEALRIAQSLTGIPLRDIAFPSRNLVAHGRAFGESEDAFRGEVCKQTEAVHKWVADIFKHRQPGYLKPTECDRWLLFMRHWSEWLKTFVQTEVNCSI